MPAPRPLLRPGIAWAYVRFGFIFVADSETMQAVVFLRVRHILLSCEEVTEGQGFDRLDHVVQSFSVRCLITLRINSPSRRT